MNKKNQDEYNDVEQIREEARKSDTSATTAAAKPKVNKKYDGSDDPTLLLVKGATGDKEENKYYIKGLATAICTCYQKHKLVKLRCIGKGALGNAVYAHAIAKLDMLKQGINLLSSPSYQTVKCDDNVERTAIVIELRAIDGFVENK